jgi:catechol 2,3-dioxygenase-like lactoylglutathione lyase family enzyme
MLQCLDHVNIVVKDLDRALAFYRDLLGLRETMRARLEGDWIEQVTGVRGVSADCIYLEFPSGARVELLAFRAPDNGAPLPANAMPATPGLRHIAFRVDDIDAVYTRLVAAGVKFVNPPATVPTSIVKHATGRKRLCYFHDPEGTLLEIAEFKPIEGGQA